MTEVSQPGAEIAAACRVLASLGHNDVTLGHISLRDPDGRGFWLKASGLGLDEVTSDDVVLVSFDGVPELPDARLHIEWPIHAALYQARPDVHSVGHTHPRWGHLAACLTGPVRPLGNHAVAFPDGVPLYGDTPDLIRNLELGRAVASVVGQGRGALLTHHGVVFCGTSIAEAAVTGVWLEELCRTNVLLGDRASEVARDQAVAKATRTLSDSSVEGFWAYLRRRYS